MLSTKENQFLSGLFRKLVQFMMINKVTTRLKNTVKNKNNTLYTLPISVFNLKHLPFLQLCLIYHEMDLSFS